MASPTLQAADAPLQQVVGVVSRHPDVSAWIEDVRADTGRGHARIGEAILPLLLGAAHAGVADKQRRHDPVEARGLLVVCASDADAEQLAESVGWYIGPSRAAPYLSRAVRYGSGVAPSPARIGLRERARRVMAENGVVVASVQALLERAVAPASRPTAVRVATDQTLERDGLVGQLVNAGYERTEQADERGKFAVRGDIVDVFGTTSQYPVRVEFFDDEIESIRQFSPYTQRSLGPLTSIAFQPASEVAGMGSSSEWWQLHDSGDDASTLMDPVLEAAGDATEPGWTAFAGSHLVVWQAAQVQRSLDDELAEIGASHVTSSGWVDEQQITKLLSAADRLDPLPLSQQHVFEAQPPVFGAIGFAEAEAELKGLAGRGLRVVVTFPHAGHLSRTDTQIKRVTTHTLATQDIDEETGVWLAVSLLGAGFISPKLGLAVVPSGRLFRTRVTGGDGSAAGRVGQAMQAFTSLRVGDYVVHEDHGIGRFAGFETKTVGGVTRDYLRLEFSGEDKVYVPHEQMGKVTRYVGADGNAPTLSKLGGKRWDTLRNRARQAVRELAGELLALYAKRARAVGRAAVPDEEMMEKFELSFPYTETDDQLTAIAAVKHDMEQPHPMDRLVCGDVGFGKTEVAMRASMKSVVSSRQVMILVPTTILADQHLRSFRERFEHQPVTIDMVSRFRSTKETKEILKRFSEGKIDVLIGTHRLLSRDVLPKDLGLVVVDEEQRFGVQQKELLRQLRLEVDVLALSATPIPRTLHMSLAGIRDITVIETAPIGRRPIATHVGEYDEELIRMSITRELERNGQVFYLHNRVETIDEAAARIRQIVPDARVGVGHGQMTEKQLESVMVGFMRRDFDVLVATTIIESGLDIPDANTLIVERADKLGLSQLYQIRGRVGRSARSSHAYLFYPSARELSEEARARLTTLSDFTDLGSGSRIAMRDLELRGAGNLLGAEQSGHVAAVGFELYMDMLAEAVSEMSGEPMIAERQPLIETRLHAYVPQDYVASEAIKIDIHRRIALARDEARLDELLVELEDRFGEVPDVVRNLVDISRMRLLMVRVGADRLHITPTKVGFGPLRMTHNQQSFLKGEVPAVVVSSTGEVAVRIAHLDEGGIRALELLRAVARVLGR